MVREIDVPNELLVLLPEENKRVVVIGSKGYEMYPMVEGQLEKVMKDVGQVFAKILSSDRKCPKCQKIYKAALERKITECSDCKEWLDDERIAPMDAIVSSGKVPDWVEIILGIPKAEAQMHMTLNQIKHFAAVFWKQNFSDEGLPGETKSNFEKLLLMFGLTREEKKAPTAATEKTRTQEIETSLSDQVTEKSQA